MELVVVKFRLQNFKVLFIYIFFKRLLKGFKYTEKWARIGRVEDNIITNFYK